MLLIFFFFNDTATTEIYTLSLHDALPIYGLIRVRNIRALNGRFNTSITHAYSIVKSAIQGRSEERFSRNAETDLVCRLLLEKKKTRPMEELRQEINAPRILHPYHTNHPDA